MSLTEPKDIIYRAYYRVWNTTANRDVRHPITNVGFTFISFYDI